MDGIVYPSCPNHDVAQSADLAPGQALFYCYNYKYSSQLKKVSLDLLTFINFDALRYTHVNAQNAMLRQNDETGSVLESEKIADLHTTLLTYLSIKTVKT